MKVFLGFLLLVSMTMAAVDEKEATPVVPESKKTDLLITANGQTIKVNTDGKTGNPFGLSAHRFRQSRYRNARVQTRHMEGGDGAQGEEVEEFDIDAVYTMITELQTLVNDAGESGNVVMSKESVEEIIYMLETFNAFIQDDSFGRNEDRKRRKLSTSYEGCKTIKVKNVYTRICKTITIPSFTRRHRSQVRRQSVIHHSHFHNQNFVHGHRIVVNP